MAMDADPSGNVTVQYDSAVLPIGSVNEPAGRFEGRV